MTPLEWQARAVREVGSGVQNAVYEVRLPFGVTGGFFTLTGAGNATTALPFNASAQSIEQALGALAGVGTNGAKVSGPMKGPFTVEVVGANAGQTLPLGWLLGDGSALTPPSTLVPVLLQNGVASGLLSQAATIWNSYNAPLLGGEQLDGTYPSAPALPDYERFLYTKRDLLRSELARYAGLVDQRDGDAESKDSQKFANLRALLSQNQADIDLLIQNRVHASSNNTVSGVMRRTQEVGAEFALSRVPFWRRGNC